jgi:hypothetical protein
MNDEIDDDSEHYDLQTEFEQIMLDIKDKIERALDIVKFGCDRIEYERAKSYWYAHIRMAIDNDHPYLGKNYGTMDDSLHAIAEKMDDDVSDDE